MVISPDGRTLAVRADETRMMLWDLAGPTRSGPLATLGGVAFGGAMAFSPDGRTLATADDRTLTLWNVADRSAPVRGARLTGHSGYVSAAAFSPDGRTLVSGGRDTTAMLWDVTDRANPHRLATLTGHEDVVRSVAFSPDGRTLATGGRDYTVNLWDTTNPAGPIRLTSISTGIGGEAVRLAFRRDGQTLAVAGVSSSRATVTLWNYGELNSLRADPARYACGITGRGLTAGEWARYVPEFPYRRTC